MKEQPEALTTAAIREAHNRYPAEWHYESDTISSLRAFIPPDLTKLSQSDLNNNSLYIRLILTFRDLNHAYSAAKLILLEYREERSYSISRLRQFACYETALIVSYCRPFAEARGSAPPLSFKALAIKPFRSTSRLHKRVMEVRNKISAHSDVDFIEYSGPHIEDIDTGDDEEFAIVNYPTFNEGLTLSFEEISQMHILVLNLRTAVYERLCVMHPSFSAQKRIIRPAY